MTKKTDNVDITGMKKAEALTALIQGGMDYPSAEKYWKENGSKASTGFAADFYAALKDGPMDDATFDATISAGSANVQKHKSHYNAIRLLTNSIHGE